VSVALSRFRSYTHKQARKQSGPFTSMMISWSQPMPVLRSVSAVARFGSDAVEICKASESQKKACENTYNEDKFSHLQVCVQLLGMLGNAYRGVLTRIEHDKIVAQTKHLLERNTPARHSVRFLHTCVDTRPDTGTAAGNNANIVLPLSFRSHFAIF